MLATQPDACLGCHRLPQSAAMDSAIFILPDVGNGCDRSLRFDQNFRQASLKLKRETRLECSSGHWIVHAILAVI